MSKSFQRKLVAVCLLLGVLCVVQEGVAAFCPRSVSFGLVESARRSYSIHPPQHGQNLQQQQQQRPLFAIHARKVQTAMQSNNAFRGKLMIVMSKLMVAPAKYVEVVRRVLEQTYWPEVFLIACMIQGSIPLAQYIHRRRHKEFFSNASETNNGNPDNVGDSPTEDGESITSSIGRDEREEEEAWRRAFEKSKSIKIARVLRQLGLLQGALYVSDVIWVILKHLDFKFVVKYQVPQVTGSIITACWLAWNTSRLKYHYLTRREMTPTTNGSIVRTTPRTLNRLGDIFIYACAFLTVVDSLGVEIGFALKSIFGLGSFGTLALSLASKDLAAEFVGGLMIQTSNFFNEGEVVVLQDGTKGSVAKIGWLVCTSFFY